MKKHSAVLQSLFRSSKRFRPREENIISLDDAKERISKSATSYTIWDQAAGKWVSHREHPHFDHSVQFETVQPKSKNDEPKPAPAPVINVSASSAFARLTNFQRAGIAAAIICFAAIGLFALTRPKEKEATFSNSAVSNDSLYAASAVVAETQPQVPGSIEANAVAIQIIESDVRAPAYLSVPARAPVNINTASADQLDGVQYIGPLLAQEIVAHRQKNGPFRSVEDLDAVKGIGSSMLDQIRSNLFVTNNVADGKPPENYVAPPRPESAKPDTTAWKVRNMRAKPVTWYYINGSGAVVNGRGRMARPGIEMSAQLYSYFFTRDGYTCAAYEDSKLVATFTPPIGRKDGVWVIK